MRIKALIGVVAAMLVVALAGCGAGSSSDSPASAAKARTANAAQAQRLLAQTFGSNPAASSGMVSGTIDIHVKGVARFEQVSLSMSGPFSQSGGGPPEANLALGVTLRQHIYGADMYLVANHVLIGLGSTVYRIPPRVANPIRRPLANADNALGAILGVFSLAPQRWAKDPRIVGSDRVAGIDVIHGTAAINTRQFFLDVAKFTKVLTSLRFTEIAGLPQVIGPNLRAALVRSVTSATGDVYTGASDHVLRKATFNITLKPSTRDRKLLAGITSMGLVGDLNVSDVGAPQTISPPTARGSYAALQLTLDALGEAARRDAKRGTR